jgi:hypothetical protein
MLFIVTGHENVKFNTIDIHKSMVDTHEVLIPHIAESHRRQ